MSKEFDPLAHLESSSGEHLSAETWIYAQQKELESVRFTDARMAGEIGGLIANEANERFGERYFGERCKVSSDILYRPHHDINIQTGQPVISSREITDPEELDSVSTGYFDGVSPTCHLTPRGLQVTFNYEIKDPSNRVMDTPLVVGRLKTIAPVDISSLEFFKDRQDDDARRALVALGMSDEKLSTYVAEIDDLLSHADRYDSTVLRRVDDLYREAGQIMSTNEASHMIDLIKSRLALYDDEQFDVSGGYEMHSEAARSSYIKASASRNITRVALRSVASGEFNPGIYLVGSSSEQDETTQYRLPLSSIQAIKPVVHSRDI